MRDDPVGDINREIVGCIACTGSRDEHKIPRAVVCRVRVGCRSKHQERNLQWRKVRLSSWMVFSCKSSSHPNTAAPIQSRFTDGS
jgi:hypothetical protein